MLVIVALGVGKLDFVGIDVVCILDLDGINVSVGIGVGLNVGQMVIVGSGVGVLVCAGVFVGVCVGGSFVGEIGVGWHSLQLNTVSSIEIGFLI